MSLFIGFVLMALFSLNISYAQDTKSEAEKKLQESLQRDESIRNNVDSEVSNPWSRVYSDPWTSQFWGGTTGKQTLAGGVDIITGRLAYKTASKIDLETLTKVKDISQVASVKDNLERFKIAALQNQSTETQQDIIDSLESELQALQKMLEPTAEAKSSRGHYTEVEIQQRIAKLESRKNNLKFSQKQDSGARQKAYISAKTELQKSLDSLNSLPRDQRFFAHNYLATQIGELNAVVNPNLRKTNPTEIQNRILMLEKKGLQKSLTSAERLQLEDLYQQKVDQITFNKTLPGVRIAASVRDLNGFYSNSTNASSNIMDEIQEELRVSTQKGDSKKQKQVEAELQKLRNGHYQGISTASRAKIATAKCTKNVLYVFAFKEFGTAAWRVLYAYNWIPGSESSGDPGWTPMGTYLAYCFDEDGEPVGEDLLPEEKAKLKEYYKKSQQNLPPPQPPTQEETDSKDNPAPKKDH